MHKSSLQRYQWQLYDCTFHGLENRNSGKSLGYARGIERSGQAGANSISWTSKYGSIITSAWDIATADGMNEKGLVANILWLVETEYPKFNPEGDKEGMAVSLWGQFALDNFANVKEAVDYFKKDEVAIVSDYLPGTDTYATVHLSLSDPSGDNAIF